MFAAQKSEQTNQPTRWSQTEIQKYFFSVEWIYENNIKKMESGCYFLWNHFLDDKIDEHWMHAIGE